MSLTKKQKEILDVIVAFQEDKGYSPTYREIADMTQVSSIGGIAAHIQKIEARGYIRTIKGNRRMIEVLRTKVTPGSEPVL